MSDKKRAIDWFWVVFSFAAGVAVMWIFAVKQSKTSMSPPAPRPAVSKLAIGESVTTHQGDTITVVDVPSPIGVGMFERCIVVRSQMGSLSSVCTGQAGFARD